jgi:hypothetical protein
MKPRVSHFLSNRQTLAGLTRSRVETLYRSCNSCSLVPDTLNNSICFQGFQITENKFPKGSVASGPGDTSTTSQNKQVLFTTVGARPLPKASGENRVSGQIPNPLLRPLTCQLSRVASRN